mmetsp:Transcript_7409/g.12141  ORF Transcript_7409/g.12141 Transcript_7409/m.12141 type:complete len:93 (-) Transcript_7409:11-289(-)
MHALFDFQVKLKVKPPKDSEDVKEFSSKSVSVKSLLRKVKVPATHHECNIRVPAGTTLEKFEVEQTGRCVGVHFHEDSVWDGDTKELPSESE